jgi:hypothetical protein
VRVALASLVGHAAATHAWTARDLWGAGPDRLVVPAGQDLACEVPAHGVRWFVLEPT